jgi:hypothetical protein
MVTRSCQIRLILGIHGSKKMGSCLATMAVPGPLYDTGTTKIVRYLHVPALRYRRRPLLFPYGVRLALPSTVPWITALPGCCPRGSSGCMDL